MYNNRFVSTEKRALLCKQPYWFITKARALKAPRLISKACPELAILLSQIEAATIEVAFVSHSLADATSAFGHLLLYIRPHPNRLTLPIPLSVSFLGQTSGISPLERIWGGLIGTMRGRFIVQPYHVQQRQYAQFEARDIYLYPLNMTLAEQTKLAALIYKSRHQNIKYNFFSYNCAYRIQQLVLGAKNIAYKDRLQWFTSPADVLQLFNKLGLIESSPTWQPSTLKKFGYHLNRLNIAQLDRYHRIIDPKNDELDFEGISHQALTTALLYFELFHPYSLYSKQTSTDLRLRYQSILRNRLLLPVQAEVNPKQQQTKDPLMGHRRRRIRFGVSRLTRVQGDERKALTLQFSPGLHNLIDRGGGQPTNGSIDLFSTSIALDLTNNELILERLSLIEFHRIGGFVDGLANLWGINVGYGTSQIMAQIVPNMLGVDSRFGISGTLSRNNYDFMVFTAATTQLGLVDDDIFNQPAVLDHNNNLSPSWHLGAQAGFRFRYQPTFRSLILCGLGRSLIQNDLLARCNASIRVSIHQNIELEATLTKWFGEVSYLDRLSMSLQFEL